MGTMSYAEEARQWYEKAARERFLADRVKDRLLPKAVQEVRIYERGHGAYLTQAARDRAVEEKLERLLEGAAGKYRTAHFTAAREFTQYGILAAHLALLEKEGLL